MRQHCKKLVLAMVGFEQRFFEALAFGDIHRNPDQPHRLSHRIGDDVSALQPPTHLGGPRTVLCFIAFAAGNRGLDPTGQFLAVIAMHAVDEFAQGPRGRARALLIQFRAGKAPDRAAG